MQYTFLHSHTPFQMACDCFILASHLGQLQETATTLFKPELLKFLEKTAVFKDCSTSGSQKLRWIYTPDPQMPRILLATFHNEIFTPQEYLHFIDQLQSEILSLPHLEHLASNFLAIPVASRTETWKLEHWIRNWSFLSDDRSYTMKTQKTEGASQLKSLTVLATTENSEKLKACVQEAQALCEGILLSCQLANYPANIGTPDKILSIVENMVSESSDLTLNVLDRNRLKSEGFNGMLAVANGSENPPYLIEVSYRGHPNAHTAPIVFVGKGLTFDSGGISIKPAARMEYMKYDMCGAATALGILKTVTQLKLPINLTVIVGVCENMPDGNSYRPGDVLTMYNGLTVEVLNTDAEGRLVLADALAYAEKRHQPELMIDMATLTGACVVALGKHRSAIFSPNPALAHSLLAASEQSNDLGWVMPMDEIYGKNLESPIADLANCGDRDAGSITAAIFLSHFVQNKEKWAHLDIAGTAYVEGNCKRATGRPIGLLVRFLKNHLLQEPVKA